MPITAKQVQMVRLTLRSVGITEEADKDAVIREWTDGRTTHISELTHREVNRIMIAYSGDSGRSKMTGKMLSLAHEMGWTVPGDGKRKVDIERVNAWCRKYSPEHTDLDKIPTHQLGKVVSIFEKVYKDFLQGI